MRQVDMVFEEAPSEIRCLRRRLAVPAKPADMVTTAFSIDVSLNVAIGLRRDPAQRRNPHLQGPVMETAYLLTTNALPTPKPETEIAVARGGRMLFTATDVSDVGIPT
jgi:hypothetical protein